MKKVHTNSNHIATSFFGECETIKPPEKRECRGCFEFKLLKRFHWNGKYFTHYCKVCQSEKDRKRMAKNYAKKKLDTSQGTTCRVSV